MINFQCSHCGINLQISERYAGQAGKCNSCSNAITVPRAQSSKQLGYGAERSSLRDEINRQLVVLGENVLKATKYMRSRWSLIVAPRELSSLQKERRAKRQSDYTEGVRSPEFSEENLMTLSPELRKILVDEALKIREECQDIDTSKTEGKSRYDALKSRYKEIELLVNEQPNELETGLATPEVISHPSTPVYNPPTIYQTPQLEPGHVQNAPVVNIAMPRRTSSLGMASIIVGCLALFISFVPLLGIFGFMIAMLGIGLACGGFLIAASRKGSGIGYPIAGLIISSVAFLISMFQIYIISSFAE